MEPWKQLLTLLTETLLTSYSSFFSFSFGLTDCVRPTITKKKKIGHKKRGQFWSNKLKQKDFKRLIYVLQIYKLCVVMEIKTEYWHIMVMLFNYSLVTHSYFISPFEDFFLFYFFFIKSVVVLILIICILLCIIVVFYSSILFFFCGKFLYKKVHLFHDFELFFFFCFILFIDMHIHNFYVCIQII